MLDLTMGGRAVSGLDAIQFFEALPGVFPNEVKTAAFCDEYEYALNRLRFEVRKSIPAAPEACKGKFTTYSCGQCGGVVSYGTDKYCSHCGRKIDWSDKV